MLSGSVYENAPALSEIVATPLKVGMRCSAFTVSFTSRCRCEGAVRSTMLIVPAIDCVLNSALALR